MIRSVKNLLIGLFLTAVSLSAQSEGTVNVQALISSHQITNYKIAGETNATPPTLYYKMWALWSEDVLEYFDLSETFSTPLQVKAFEGSPEYQTLLAEIKKQKAELPDKEFAMTLGSVSEYILAKKAFQVTVEFDKNPCADEYTCSTLMCNPQGKCAEMGCDAYKEKDFPNARYGFLLPEIAGKGNKKTKISWLIKVPETEAINIEKAQARVRVVFSATGLESKKDREKANGKKRMPNGYSVIVKSQHNLSFDFIKTKLNRVEFIDSNDNVIHSIPW